jgi:hypothetical protein
MLFVSKGYGVAIRKDIKITDKFREAASFSAPFSR